MTTDEFKEIAKHSDGDIISCAFVAARVTDNINLMSAATELVAAWRVFNDMLFLNDVDIID